MAAFAKYPYVMTHDDDFCLGAEDSLEKLIGDYEANYLPGRAMGFNGVRLGKDLSYYPNEKQRSIRKFGIYVGAKHVEYPRENKLVDVIKGRLLFCKNDDLHNLPNYTEMINFGDDIAVSSFLASGERMHHMITPSLNDRIIELEGGKGKMALSSDESWRDTRNQIAKKYFS